MGKDVNIDLNTPMDLLEQTIKTFKDKNLVRYDAKANQFLLNLCKQDVDQYNSAIANDLRYFKKVILISKTLQIMPNSYYSQLKDSYQTGSKVMTFEKEQFSRLRNQLKKGNPKIDDGAYYYCVYLGLIKSHINTNTYIADAKAKVDSKESYFGYIPSENVQLATPEFQQTIIEALDDLCGEEVKHKCK